MALYDHQKQVIGGLGISGDTSCADHSVAYRMRHLAGFDNIPGGVAPGNTDNHCCPVKLGSPARNGMILNRVLSI